MANPYDIERNYFVQKLKLNVPYLRSCSLDSLKRLYYKSEMFFRGMESVIFNAGEKCKHLYFITQGIVGIEIFNNRGRTQQIDLLGRGSILGLNNVLRGDVWKYSAVVKSSVNANIIKIDWKQITKMTTYEKTVHTDILKQIMVNTNNGISHIDYLV